MSVSLEDELAAFEAEMAELGGDEEEDNKQQPQQSEQQHTSSSPTISSATSAAVTQPAPAPASDVSAISPSTSPQSASLPSPSSSLSSVSHTPAPPQAVAAAAGTSVVHTSKRTRDEHADGDRPASPHKRPHVISAKPAVISAPPNARNPSTPIPTPIAATFAPAAASAPASPRPATGSPAPPTTVPTPANQAPSLITPPAATTATTQPQTAATTNPPHTNKQHKQKLDPALVRSAAGSVWVDQTLTDFPPNDFRLFIGDLGIEVNDQLLSKTFAHYTSFCYARVIRDKKTALSKGFGLVSFLDHEEGLRALKEMQGKYCGNRPMKLKKGQWQKRSLETQKTRNKHLF